MILEDSATPLAGPCALWFPSETSQEPCVALGHTGVLRAMLWLSRARGWGQTGLGMLAVVSNTLLGQDLYCGFSPALQIPENGIAWICVAQNPPLFTASESRRNPPPRSNKQKQKHARILSISSTKIRRCLPLWHPRPHTPQCTWLPSENSLCAQPLFTAPAIPRRDPTDKGSLFLFPDKGSFILPRGLAVISGELHSGLFSP